MTQLQDVYCMSRPKVAGDYRQTVVSSSSKHGWQAKVTDWRHLAPYQKPVIQGIKFFAFWQLVGSTNLPAQAQVTL